MRPTSIEFLKGIRDTLKKVILPSISSDYARSQAECTISIIDRILKGWDPRPKELIAENNELKKILCHVIEFLETNRSNFEDRTLKDLMKEINTYLRKYMR